MTPPIFPRFQTNIKNWWFHANPQQRESEPLWKDLRYLHIFLTQFQETLSWNIQKPLMRQMHLFVSSMCSLTNRKPQGSSVLLIQMATCLTLVQKYCSVLYIKACGTNTSDYTHVCLRAFICNALFKGPNLIMLLQDVVLPGYMYGFKCEVKVRKPIPLED